MVYVCRSQSCWRFELKDERMPSSSADSRLEEILPLPTSSGDEARSNCPASLYKISIGKEWRLAGKRRTRAGSIKAKCDIASALFHFFNPEFFV